MRKLLFPPLVAALALWTACDQQPTATLADAPAPSFAKPACPGHPSCKDDGGGDDGGDGGSGGEASLPIDLDAVFADPGSSGSLTDDGRGAYYAQVNESENFQTRMGLRQREWRENFDRCLTIHVVAAADGSDLFGPSCVAVDNMATKTRDAGDVTLLSLAVGESGPARSSVVFGSSWLTYGRAEDDCDQGTQAPSLDANKVTITRTGDTSWTIGGGTAVYCGPDGVPVDAVAAFRIEAAAR